MATNENIMQAHKVNFFSGLAIFVFHKAIARYESENQIAMKD